VKYISLKKINRRYYFLSVALIFGLWFYYCLPNPLFKNDFSLVLLDKENQLYHVAISEDEQYRFPTPDSIPKKLVQAVLTFEDRHFYEHPGVNPLSIFQSIRQGIQGKGWRGGSTISMQVVRLATKKRGRNPFRKLIEICQALRLETIYSKSEILNLYFTHAPYGRNLVGIQAASYRYYGSELHYLSYAQCATLAVLPNAPSSIYITKQHDKLMSKRNRLLKSMCNAGIIDIGQLQSSLKETISNKTYPFPQKNHQLLQDSRKLDGSRRIKTTINPKIEQDVHSVLSNAGQLMQYNGIRNSAAIVIETETGNICAYVANTPLPNTPFASVNMINAPRSYGSLLKSFLYASALDRGIIMPQSWLSDVPSNWNGYSPHNFFNSYQGIVPAHIALSHSLNLPFVNLLQQYGTQDFIHQINALGLKKINKKANHYGLSLILGGAECSLLEITTAYQQMAKALTLNQDLYQNQLITPHWNSNPNFKSNKGNKILSKEAMFATVQALKLANRPDMAVSWSDYLNSRPIAWKTGTSFGQRDAWCVGITPGYTIGVWCGNADGKHANQLTGIKTAAPLLFQIFSNLPNTGWFLEPTVPKKNLSLCAVTNQRTSPYCEDSVLVSLPKAWSRNISCTYHKPYLANKTNTVRYKDNCLPSSLVYQYTALQLSPLQLWYSKNKNPELKTLPPLALACRLANQEIPYFIYPNAGSTLILETNGKFLAKAIATEGATQIAWHLDDNYLKTTMGKHQISISSTKGKHTLSIIDDLGAFNSMEIIVQ